MDGVPGPTTDGEPFNGRAIECSWCEWCRLWLAYGLRSNDFAAKLGFGRRRRVSPLDATMSTGGASLGIGSIFPGEEIADRER